MIAHSGCSESGEACPVPAQPARTRTPKMARSVQARYAQRIIASRRGRAKILAGTQADRVALHCLPQHTVAAFPGCTQHHGGPVRSSSARVGGLLLSFLSRSPTPG